MSAHPSKKLYMEIFGSPSKNLKNNHLGILIVYYECTKQRGKSICPIQLRL